MYVQSAFLTSPLDEEVYVEHPPSFARQGQEMKLFRLKKALYGLKQTPIVWKKKIDVFLVEIGLLKCTYEHRVYIKNGVESNCLIVCLYMDNLLVTRNNENDIEYFKSKMMQQFEMIDLGLLSNFLCIEFQRTTHDIIMHQTKYASDLLLRFNMSN